MHDSAQAARSSRSSTRARATIESRSPKRTRARRARCSSQSASSSASSRRISSLISGSYSAERRCQSSDRSSLRRSISAWISRECSHALENARTAARIPAGSSGIPEVVEAVLVEPEVVGELVEDGDPDLLLELGAGRGTTRRAAAGRSGSGRAARPPSRRARAAARPRRGRRGRGPPGCSSSTEISTFRIASRSSAGSEASARSTCSSNVNRPGSATSAPSGAACATSRIVASPKAKPPMWAKNATPPPLCGCEEREAARPDLERRSRCRGTRSPGSRG